MRGALFTLFCVLLIAGVWWWNQVPLASISRVPVVEHQDLSSLTKNNMAPPVGGQTQEGQTQGAPQRAYQQVGAHPGVLIPFSQRRLERGSGRETSPTERYRGLEISAALKINNHDQQVLAARAIPTPDYSAKQFGPLLFEENGFSIVAVDTRNSEPWADLVVHEADRPVVVNPANGRLGVVTGTVILKLRNIADAEKIATRENFKLLSVDSTIDTAYFRARENYGLVSGSQRLQRDPGITRVELEVVQGRLELR